MVQELQKVFHCLLQNSRDRMVQIRETLAWGQRGQAILSLPLPPPPHAHLVCRGARTWPEESKQQMLQKHQFIQEERNG